MEIGELYTYAYLKKPLNEIYSDPSSVPEEFLMEWFKDKYDYQWFKDKYDYQRLHSDEELLEFLELTPEQIMTWLKDAAIFAWEAKREWLKGLHVSSTSSSKLRENQ
jgi:hypothetical protein